MPHKRFKPEWREAAAKYARQFWHVPEWRYFSADGGPREKILEAAAGYYRQQLNTAYRESIEHLRSRKAVESVRRCARDLASVVLYSMEVA